MEKWKVNTENSHTSDGTVRERMVSRLVAKPQSLRSNRNVVPKKKGKLERVAGGLKSRFTTNIRCFVRDERTRILKGL